LVMRAPALIVWILLLGTQAADARHYHFYRFHWGGWSHMRVQRAPALDPTTTAPRSEQAPMRILGRPFPPPDWQLQPTDANQKGRRYLSPDGMASLVFYASPAGRESASEHLKSVAFVDGEDVLTLAGTRSEMLVTGTKGDRMFVRKARLACGGQEWHQVMLDFRADARRDHALVVAQAERALDLVDGDGCTEEPAVAANPGSDSAAPQPPDQTPQVAPPSGQSIR
jgi:serine/threonine-protein kinase